MPAECCEREARRSDRGATETGEAGTVDGILRRFRNPSNPFLQMPKGLIFLSRDASHSSSLHNNPLGGFLKGQNVRCKTTTLSSISKTQTIGQRKFFCCCPLQRHQSATATTAATFGPNIKTFFFLPTATPHLDCLDPCGWIGMPSLPERVAEQTPGQRGERSNASSVLPIQAGGKNVHQDHVKVAKYK